MTPDEILAKVREARHRAANATPEHCDPEYPLLQDVPELCDIIEGLVARVLDQQQDLTDALDYASHEIGCPSRHARCGETTECDCGLAELVARSYPPTDAPPIDRIPGEVEAVARRMIVTGRSEIAVTLADGRTARLRLGGTADAGKADNALDQLIATLPDPPPGKMRVTASVPVSYDVSPGQIAAYMRAKGWEQKPSLREGVAYFEREESPPIGVFFGTNLRWPDWRYVTECLVKAVALHENRSSGEVLGDIAAMEEA